MKTCSSRFVYGFSQLYALRPPSTVPPFTPLPFREFRADYPAALKGRNDARSFYNWRHTKSCGLGSSTQRFPLGNLKPLSSGPTLPSDSAGVFKLHAQENVGDCSMQANSQEPPLLPGYAVLELAQPVVIARPLHGRPVLIKEPVYDTMSIRTLKPNWFLSQLGHEQQDAFSFIWQKGFDLLVHAPCPAHFSRSSLSWQQLRYLLQHRFCLPWPHEKIVKGFVSLFHVWKRNGTLRVIGNPEVNSRLDWPYKVCIPQTQDMVSALTGARFLISEDLQSCYPQIPLHSQAMSFFVFVKDGKKIALACLPQGFKPSCYLAQHTTMCLARGCGDPIVVVDNVLLSAYSLVTIVAHLQRFHHRCSMGGAVLKPGAVIAKQTVFCGRMFDLSLQSWRLDPDWCTKTLPILQNYLVLGKALTFKQVYQCCGLSVWVLQVFLVPMSAIIEARAVMSYIGDMVQKYDSPWDTPFVVTQQFIDSLSYPLALVSSNPWREFSLPPRQPLVLASDASLYGGAWGSPFGAAYWGWPVGFDSSFMFMLEIITMIHAVSMSASLYPLPGLVSGAWPYDVYYYPDHILLSSPRSCFWCLAL